MEEILAISERYGIKILEYAAEGLGSVYKGKNAGAIGDAGVFSFHGTKTVSTGEGGILVTNDAETWERAKILNDHGRNPKDNKAFWMRDFGYKYKMSNLQAAMGCAQIERADELIEKKRTIFKWYRELFQDFPCKMNPEPLYAKNSYWMPTIVFDRDLDVNRDDLMEHLKKHGIDSRPFFYPLSSLPMFENKPENEVSYDIYDRGINLPSHHEISFEQVERVVQTIKDYTRR